MNNELVRWDDIERRIDVAKDIKVITEMQEQMEALKVLARQQEGGLKTVNKCAAYKFKLEQKAGEIYAAMEAENKPGPGRGKTPLPDETTFSTSKQRAEEETGKSRKTLNTWAKETEVPEDFIESFVATCNDEGKEVTSAALLRTWKEEQPRPESEPLPEDKYSVIYADPPWKYTSGHQHAEREQNTVIADHYGSLSLEEICELPVLDMANDNAVLFLWVTSPLLEEAFLVINAWGFQYKTSMVWDKVKHNVGSYVSVRHELLLICTRGSYTPRVKKLYDSVYVEERTEHSKKPEWFRRMIDEIYPEGNRIELFAREKAPGWDVWGNEV